MSTKDLAVRKQMIETCLRLERMGYFIGTWGNLSARVPDGVLVTPSRIPYNVIEPEDFMLMSLEGDVVSGHRLPSSEAGIHCAMYRAKPDIGAIVHCHSTYASAVSCLQLSIPAFVEDLVQIVGGQVNCAPYVPAGQHNKLADAVAGAIGESGAVLLANHGVLTCGRDLEEAVVASQIVEKAAQMMLACASIGPVIPIPEESVRSERHRFLFKYGTKNDVPE